MVIDLQKRGWYGLGRQRARAVGERSDQAGWSRTEGRATRQCRSRCRRELAHVCLACFSTWSPR